MELVTVAWYTCAGRSSARDTNHKEFNCIPGIVHVHLAAQHMKARAVAHWYCFDTKSNEGPRMLKWLQARSHSSSSMLVCSWPHMLHNRHVRGDPLHAIMLHNRHVQGDPLHAAFLRTKPTSGTGTYQALLCCSYSSALHSLELGWEGWWHYIQECEQSLILHTGKPS